MSTRILVGYFRSPLNLEREFRRFGQMRKYNKEGEAVQEQEVAATLAGTHTRGHRDRTELHKSIS